MRKPMIRILEILWWLCIPGLLLAIFYNDSKNPFWVLFSTMCWAVGIYGGRWLVSQRNR